MKMILKQISFLAVALILFAFASNAQTKTTKTDEMKTYVIERETPQVGRPQIDPSSNVSAVMTAPTSAADAARRSARSLRFHR